MRPIAISLSPNVERDDIRIAVRTLLMPWRWRTSSARQEAERYLARYFHNRSVILTGSGRSAIYYALQALDIGRGDEVIIQAFTCLAVPAPIIWTGARPVYADIDPHTYNLDPANVAAKITPATKAIIVQHTFGIPADIEALRQIANKHNLILIEDIAHALGGTYHGRPLGTFGDIAIASFGRDKTVSCVFGGAVITNREDLAQTIRNQQEQLPPPPWWWNIQQLLHPLLLNVALRLYFVLSIGKLLLVLAQKLRLISKAVSSREKQGDQPPFIAWQFSPALAPLLLNQLQKLDRFTKQRQTYFHRYHQALGLPSDLVHHADGAAWLRIPYRVANNRATLLKARRHRMLLGDWYNTPVTPCPLKADEITGYQAGSCPEAEKASRQVINLPTHPTLTNEDVERVITFLTSHD